MREREPVQKYLSFQLTTWGLIQNVQRGDVSLYSSTLFSEISGGEVISTRYSWLALLSALFFVIGVIALGTGSLFAGFIILFFAMIFLMAYIATKKTVLRFTNTGGVSMSHIIQGNQRQACAKFIHLVETWKLNIRDEPTEASTHPSEDS